MTLISESIPLELKEFSTGLIGYSGNGKVSVNVRGKKMTYRVSVCAAIVGAANAQ